MIALVLLATQASVQKYIVTSNGDPTGAHCPSSTKCSYRAVLEEITKSDYKKVVCGEPCEVHIQLPPGTITVSTSTKSPKLPTGNLPQLQNLDSILIIGDPSGTTLDGSGELQLLYTHTGVSVNISDVTFHRGSASLMQNKTKLYQGGAIVNAGSMRLERCHFRQNVAKDAAGAILNNGDLFMEGCSFRESRAVSGGAISSQGSASPRVEALDCDFEGNEATVSGSGNGGAIENQGDMKLIK